MASKKPAKHVQKMGGGEVKGDQAVREQVGLRRWMRITARKSAQAPRKAGKSDNDAAAAAAEALAQMLKEAGKRT